MWLNSSIQNFVLGSLNKTHAYKVEYSIKGSLLFFKNKVEYALKLFFLNHPQIWFPLLMWLLAGGTECGVRTRWAPGAWSHCTICTNSVQTHISLCSLSIVSKHTQSVTDSLHYDNFKKFSAPHHTLPGSGCRSAGGWGGKTPVFKLHFRYLIFLEVKSKTLLWKSKGLLKLTTVNSTTYGLISLIVGGAALAIAFGYLITVSPTFQSQFRSHYRSFNDGESKLNIIL